MTGIRSATHETLDDQLRIIVVKYMELLKMDNIQIELNAKRKPLMVKVKVSETKVLA